MADSEDKSLNNIFMSTKMRSSSGKTKIIPNTAQNMYINQEDTINKTSKGKKTGTLLGGAKSSNKTSSSATTLNSILSGLGSGKGDKKNKVAFEKESFGETEDDENLSGSESGSEDDSDEEDASSIPEEVDPNDEPVDSDQSDAESEAGSAIGSEESEESEEDEEDEKEAETEYNDEDEKDERNNDEPDDDCLYQYDDLVDERDTDRQPVQIPNDQRTTDPQMTHYERIRLLGIRTKQISMGAKVMVKYDGQLGATELAKYELNNKTTPLIIKRPLPDNTYELWKVSELNIGDDDNEQLVEELNQSFEQNQNLYQLV